MTRSTWPLTTSGDELKLPQQIARRLEREIIDDNLPIGHIIGTEKSIIARLGISRSTFREAVRILENLGVAGMRTGREGGLAVRKPEPATVVDALTRVFQYQGVAAEELLDARVTVELAILERLFDTLDEAKCAEISDYLKGNAPVSNETLWNGRGFHEMLGEMAGNRPLALLSDSLSAVGRGRVLGSDVAAQSSRWQDVTRAHKAHLQIGKALINGDLPAALASMKRHLEASKVYWRVL